MHLVGFIVRIYHDARSAEHQIRQTQHYVLCALRQIAVSRAKPRGVRVISHTSKRQILSVAKNISNDQ